MQRMYITYVEKEGPCLKIWGQTDRTIPAAVERHLTELTPQFEQGIYMPGIDNIQIGVLCCAKYNDGSYYRARITNNALLRQGMVEVHFLDYGNRELIPLINIRMLTNFPPGLISVPPQAKEFILAQVTHSGFTWDDNVLLSINNELRYLELQWCGISQIGNFILIRLVNNSNEDVASSLVNKGLVLSLALPAQTMVLQSYCAHMPPGMSGLLSPAVVRTADQTPPTILTYKAYILEPGSEHSVYISYVTDGPCQFSIQLQKCEEFLARMMSEINMIALQPLEEIPLPGTVCFARCLEDSHICRAVITTMVDNQCKVYYVDFGNSEIVPVDNLYQIPFKFVIPKVMAMRFALTGLEKTMMTVQMKCLFKEYVSEKLFKMRVCAPSPTRSTLPLCELWDENNIYVLDMLKAVAVNAYPNPTPLTRGLNFEVKVTYVYSCNRFYVQLKAKELELVQLMAELQQICPTKARLNESCVSKDLPCFALYDGEWYRAQIVDLQNGAVKVRYVDYGNEEDVTVDTLCEPVPELISRLRPQAIECCLSGYQNMEVDTERDNILETIILEQYFNMRVIDVQTSRALVDLIDSSHYNVASLLLDKIATARSQVHPVLVQDDHTVESHKKSSPPPKFERKSPRREGGDAWQPRDDKPKRFDNNRGDGDFRNRNSEPRRDKDGWKEKKKDSYYDDNPKPFDDGDKPRFKKDSYGSDRKNYDGDKPSFKRDNFNDGDKPYFKRDNFNDGDKPYFKRDNFNDGDRSNFKRDNFNDGDKPNFKKKRDGGSEKSWSDGSEKSYQRPKTSDKPPFKKSGFRSDSIKPARKMASPPPIDVAPSSAQFAETNVTGKTEVVSISWFHNPTHFYCQLESGQFEFRAMMTDMQAFYQSRKTIRAGVGAPVVAQFPEDGVFYRARILEAKDCSYRVYFVDFGNISVTELICPIDTKFMRIPAQAIYCGLDDVAPIGEAWDVADKYSLHFDKDLFTCFFKSMKDDKYAVALLSGQEDLAVALVLNGLANNPNEVVDYPVDLKLLIGQQLRVTISEVNDLDDFKVQLDSRTLSCTLLNKSSSMPTTIPTLKQLVDCSLIVCVHNVAGERLEVVLYDTNGNALKLTEPFDATPVQPLCPMPMLRSSVKGWVTHSTPTSWYIQPSEQEASINQLLESLFQYYDSGEITTVEPQIGGWCVCHSSDGNWYRGKIVEVESDTATVQYIDYGNSETVPKSEVRELSSEFFQPHILAVEVNTTEEPNLDQEVNVELCRDENGWRVALPGEAKAVIEEPMQTIGFPVILSHTDSPNEFYLQLFDDQAVIETIQANLQEQVSGFPDLDNPVVGVLCAAPYSLDQMWYRAQVLDADADITTVRFVDYGNTDVIDNSTTRVKTLSPELLATEPHARRCSLNIKPIGEEWSTSTHERFEELTAVDSLSVEIVQQDDKTTYVELYANGASVSEVLLKEKLALGLKLETEDSTGYISHLNSPSEFWIQLENSVGDLELIADRLQSAEGFPELEDLTPGSLCAALFPDDEMWYRARILSNTIAGIEVVFIDYGNSCTCTALRQLPEELLMLPALAQKSCLQKPPGMIQWSPQATEKFKEISADGATIFKIQKVTTAETSSVKLMLNDEDVSHDLRPVTKDVYVSHVESIDCFYLLNTEDEIRLGELTEKMTEASSWPLMEEPMADKIGAVLFVDDECWYRAKILSKGETDFEVFFVDFGNTTTTDSIRALTDEIEKEPPFATKCKLEQLPGTHWTADSIEQLRELAQYGQTVFQVEYITSDNVRLYVNGCDIRAKIECVPSTVVSSVTSTPKKGCDTVRKEVLFDEVLSGTMSEKTEVETLEEVPVEAEKIEELEAIPVEAEKQEETPVEVENQEELPVEVAKIEFERQDETPLEIEKQEEISVEVEKQEETPVEIEKQEEISIDVAKVEVEKQEEIPVEVEKQEEIPVEVEKQEEISIDVAKVEVENQEEIPVEVEKQEEISIDVAKVEVEKQEETPVEVEKREEIPVDVAKVEVEKQEETPVKPENVKQQGEIPVEVEKLEETQVKVESVKDQNKEETPVKTEDCEVETQKETPADFETDSTEYEDLESPRLTELIDSKQETEPSFDKPRASTPKKDEGESHDKTSDFSKSSDEPSKPHVSPIPIADRSTDQNGSKDYSFESAESSSANDSGVAKKESSEKSAESV